jgi:hypothetical protein
MLLVWHNIRSALLAFNVRAFELLISCSMLVVRVHLEMWLAVQPHLIGDKVLDLET